MKDLTLIIPCKNEKGNILKVINEVTVYSFIKQILIVVDKNSEKRQIKKMLSKFKNVKIIKQSKKGYGSAIIEGFKRTNTKYGCIFNADYSFHPKYLSLMLKNKKKLPFTFGSRYKKNGSTDDDDMFTFVGNMFFTSLCKLLFNFKLSDVLYTYVMCDVKSFNKLKMNSQDFTFCIELPYKVNQKFNYNEIAMHERKRFSGVKKVNNIKDGFLILIKILKFFFINRNVN
ncbi:glycosyltransferase family 2 protein [Candidatus Pelagibacter sp. HIMB1517]|uniref:glycosyltransferase family 2 protein n=1 Tax=Candidatus Pelagibacter sp. HIMB1517 TaxID=3413341 RepID=UPI003F82A83D